MKRMLIHKDHFLSGWIDEDHDTPYVTAMVLDARGGVRAIRSDYVVKGGLPHELLEELLLDACIVAGLSTENLEVGA